MIGKLIYFISVLGVGFYLSSCSQKNFSSKPAYQFKSATGKPDYADLHYWAAHPWKWDPSDSIPKPLLASTFRDSVVDVFFVHPTTLTSSKNTSSNAAIDDAEINSKTDYSAILYQASVFNEQSRVFAPRYRQAHYQNYFTADSTTASKSFAMAYEDVKSAFETYLRLYNNGRPIVIAAHSQGTSHAARLIKEFFEGKLLQNKLVCAYLIGMPIPETYFTTFKPCADSLGTGCFVSWRTFQKGFEGSDYVLKETFKATVTNPLTWKTDTLPGPAALNAGAVLKNFNKLVPGVTDATVYKNILWSSKPKFFGNILLTQKNYHVGDINLFYSNIRQNVKTRIGMFWKN
ncbi:MAG: DUF3089 domain-containing protein [Gloeobacteraceae cyanobacterium ES-bin-316]|nr:DUF3089 domain-containing protein [Ferruginibacter sp.]